MSILVKSKYVLFSLFLITLAERAYAEHTKPPSDDTINIQTLELKYFGIEYSEEYPDERGLALRQVNYRYTKLINVGVITVGLTGLGLTLNNSYYEQQIQLYTQNNLGHDFSLRLDDYTQYAPIAVMYSLDAFGVKSQSHWFDQTKYLILSNLVTSLITDNLKDATRKLRPNGSFSAFPSAHTTRAFTNASVFYNEFKGTSTLLAYSGYAFSVSTGALRIMNNAHWISDVLIGAAIGIFVTEVIYHYKPFKDFNPFINCKLSITPTIEDNFYGLHLKYTFSNVRLNF